MPFGYRFSHKRRIFKIPRALKKGTDSTITWQSGSNNLYTVPDDGGCGETASSWR